MHQKKKENYSWWVNLICVAVVEKLRRFLTFTPFSSNFCTWCLQINLNYGCSSCQTKSAADMKLESLKTDKFGKSKSLKPLWPLHANSNCIIKSRWGQGLPYRALTSFWKDLVSRVWPIFIKRPFLWKTLAPLIGHFLLKK